MYDLTRTVMLHFKCGWCFVRYIQPLEEEDLCLACRKNKGWIGLNFVISNDMELLEKF